MTRSDFDVIGIHNEDITGYVDISDLKTGYVSDYMRHFIPGELISETTPLIDLMPILKDRERIFVLCKNRIDRIVTRSDLQKAPVRMLIFGFISIMEMHLLQIIKDVYPNNTWEKQLHQNRIESAKKIFNQRKNNNEALDLVDCIQFSDKRDLLMRKNEIWSDMGFTSKTAFRKFFTNAEQLRNKLAHAQEIDTGSSWPEIIGLVIHVELLIQKLESLYPTD